MKKKLIALKNKALQHVEEHETALKIAFGYVIGVSVAVAVDTLITRALWNDAEKRVLEDSTLPEGSFVVQQRNGEFGSVYPYEKTED